MAVCSAARREISITCRQKCWKDDTKRPVGSFFIVRGFEWWSVKRGWETGLTPAWGPGYRPGGAGSG